MKFTVVIEEGKGTWGASVPDLPGCVAAADSRTEVLRLIREAIGLHLESMRASGDAIPSSGTRMEIVEVEPIQP